MTEETKAILKEAGMDVDAALSRFMNNEALLEKFLKKFRNDPSYKELNEAVENQDVEAGFRAAHTLKGVAANFSFETLRSAVSEQTESFRAGKLEDGISHMPHVVEAYKKIEEAIIQIYGEE